MSTHTSNCGGAQLVSDDGRKIKFKNRRNEAAPQLICNLIAPISNSIFFRHLECHVSGMPVRTTPTTQIHLATSLFTIRSTSNYAPSYPILPWAATLPFMCVVIKYRI